MGPIKTYSMGPFRFSGITVKGIINMSMDTKNMDSTTREKNVGIVARHIQDCLNIQRDLEKFKTPIASKAFGVFSFL